VESGNSALIIVGEAAAAAAAEAREQFSGCDIIAAASSTQCACLVGK